MLSVYWFLRGFWFWLNGYRGIDRTQTVRLLPNILCSAAIYGLSIIDTSLGPMFRVIRLANILTGEEGNVIVGKLF